MNRIRVFISSVQSEFSRERAMLFDYLRQDALLGQLFEPFIFERTEARDTSVQKVYLDHVRMCDIYIGVFGEKYGREDGDGVSPTEREYDLAAELHKTRLIYIKRAARRDKKESAFINKIEMAVVRKSFSDANELKAEIYASLIRYLEEKEIIRLFPFDATFSRAASIEDIDERKVKNFVARAKVKRNFPFDANADYRTVLSHLNLVVGDRVTNAAILLFGKRPQKFLTASSVKCCQFYGNRTEKPIPSYHIYEGDVFELIDQAVSFVMSRINAKVGGRDKSVLADVVPELPLQAVTEAIVNAVCHRDYTSSASVQVMLFKNRLEIWNPGQLPYGLTTEMLKTHHRSQPANPLLATPMYLYGSIEQMGTGTEMIVRMCKKYGLQTPEFQQSEIFQLTFWRNVMDEEEKDANKEKSAKIIEKHGKKVSEEPRESHKTTTRKPQESHKKATGKPQVTHKKATNTDIPKLTGNQRIMLDTILEKPYIKSDELSEIVGIRADSIRKNLLKLKTMGLIERIGPNRDGYWKVRGRGSFSAARKKYIS